MAFDLKNDENFIVEILLVAYNSEKTIKNSLLSIFNQTFTSWKLVVINDGSSDKTLEIINETCKKVNTKKLNIISFDKNLGLSFRLSEFEPCSKSLFIARIDADDIWMPHKLHCQISYLLEDNSLISVGSSALTQLENNKFKIGRINCFSSSAKNRFLLPFKNTFVHSSLIFRTSSFVKANGYSARYKYSQDYFLLLKLSKLGKMFSIKEPLVILRKSKNQISSKFHKEQIINLLDAQKEFQLSKLHLGVSKILNKTSDTKIRRLLKLIPFTPYLIFYIIIFLKGSISLFFRNLRKKVI